MKRLFFSVSSKDDIAKLNELMIHFSVFKGKVDLKYKESFMAGSDINKSIMEYIDSSDFVLPILSSDFSNDETCREELEISKEKKKEIIPILLREFLWQHSPEIKELEDVIIPKDKIAVFSKINSNFSNKDKVFVEIVSHVNDKVFPNANIDITGIKITNFYKFFTVISSVIGIIATILSFVYLTWYISLLFFLVFLCISLLIARHILFPTQISTYLNKKKYYGRKE